MAAERIQSLWAEAQSSMSLLQKTQDENSRIDALEKLTCLTRALEKPKDAILKLSYTVSKCYPRCRINDNANALTP